MDARTPSKRTRSQKKVVWSTLTLISQAVSTKNPGKGKTTVKNPGKDSSLDQLFSHVHKGELDSLSQVLPSFSQLPTVEQ